MPALYATEDVPLGEKVIRMHFFLGSCDWFVAEYSPGDRIFFGYAILNNDLINAEWGNVSFDELREVRVRGVEVDRDVYWKPTKVSAIERIAEAYRAQGCDLDR